ncbi:MAG: hypothetical protein ACXQS5_02390 [Candidatus Methanospirareceae archaeon]
MKLKEALRGVLDENALAKLIKSYDLNGDIIIIRIPPELYSKRTLNTYSYHLDLPMSGCVLLRRSRPARQ